MTRRYQFECDGCSKSEIQDADRKPDGWNDVEIKIAGVPNPYLRPGVDNFETDVLLCASCTSHLVDRSDPREWPRETLVMSNYEL